MFDDIYPVKKSLSEKNQDEIEEEMAGRFVRDAAGRVVRDDAGGIVSKEFQKKINERKSGQIDWETFRDDLRKKWTNTTSMMLYEYKIRDFI